MKNRFTLNSDLFSYMFPKLFIFSLVIFWSASIFGYKANSVKVALIWEGAIFIVFLFYIFSSFLKGKVVIWKNKLGYLMCGFLLVNFFSFWIGLSRGNELRYLIGDTANYALIPIVYLCSYAYFYKNGMRKATNMIKIILLLLSLFYFLLFLVYGSIAIVPSMFLFSYLSSVFFVNPKNKNRIFYFITILFIIFAIILSGKRMPFFQVIIIALCMFFYSIRVSKNKILKFIFTLVLFIAMVFFVFRIKQINDNLDPGWNRIFETTSLSKKDMSTHNRISEMKDVISTMETEDFLFTLIGHGNGSLWNREKAGSYRNVVFANKVHNIHILPVAFLFRQGILGLFFLFSLYVVILSMFLKFVYRKKIIRINYQFYYLAGMVFLIALVAGSFVTSRIIYNPLFGFFLAYVVFCSKNKDLIHN